MLLRNRPSERATTGLLTRSCLGYIVQDRNVVFQPSSTVDLARFARSVNKCVTRHRVKVKMSETGLRYIVTEKTR